MTDAPKMALKQLRSILPKKIAAPDLEQSPTFADQKVKEKKFIALHTILKYDDPYGQEDVFRPKMDKAPEEKAGAGKLETPSSVKNVNEKVDEFREMHHVLLKHGYETGDVKKYAHSKHGTRAQLSPSAIIDDPDKPFQRKIMLGTPMVDVRGKRFTDHKHLDAHLGHLHAHLDKHVNESDGEAIFAALSLTADGNVFVPTINEDTDEDPLETIVEFFNELGWSHEETEGPAAITYHTYSFMNEQIHVAVQNDAVLYAEKEIIE